MEIGLIMKWWVTMELGLKAQIWKNHSLHRLTDDASFQLEQEFQVEGPDEEVAVFTADHRISICGVLNVLKRVSPQSSFQRLLARP